MIQMTKKGKDLNLHRGNQNGYGIFMSRRAALPIELTLKIMNKHSITKMNPIMDQIWIKNGLSFLVKC